MPLPPWFWAFALAMTLWPHPAFAAPLTLNDALALAAQHNPRLKAAREGLQQAEAGLRQARSRYWPTLGINSDLNRTALTSVGAGLSLGLDLDTHGGMGAGRRIAELEHAIARWHVESAAQQLHLDVKSAYYDLQDAQEQIRIARISLAQAESLLEDAQAMLRGGEGTVFEVQRAEMRLFEARQAEAEAKGRQRIAERALSRQIGLPEKEVAQGIDSVAPGAPWPLSLEASIKRAMERRPEVLQLEARLELATEKRRLSLAAYGLQTQLFANANTQALMNFENSSVALVSEGPGLGPTYAVGGRLSLNLFDGGTGRANADRAAHEAEGIRAELESMRQTIRFEVEQAFVLQAISESSMRFSDASLAKAQEALEAARERLVAGIGTQTDLILAQNDLVQAEVRRNKAILDHRRALAALQKACFDLPLPESDS